MAESRIARLPRAITRVIGLCGNGTAVAWTRACAATVALAVGVPACIAIGPTRGNADPEPGEVVFELAGPGGAALTVPVKVNGAGPFPFVLDTGATVTCVDDSLVRELSLPEARGTVAFGGTVSGFGRMRLIHLESISVGNATVGGLQGCAVDLAPMRKAGLAVRGLLGLNFIREYRVTIDFPDRAVRFEAPEGKR